MKINFSVIITFFCLLLFKTNIKGQTLENYNIELTVLNIPKIEHKTQLRKNAYTIDKSPTIKYWFNNDPIKKTIAYDSIKNSTSTSFQEDTVFVKVRYNPGRSKLFILRKGDIATIDYIFDVPYLILKNRDLKKDDSKMLNAINEFEKKDIRFRFFDPFYKENKKREDIKTIKSYENIVKSLDSLNKENLISKAEYEFYKKKFIYKKATKENKYKLSVLKNKDLHIDEFEFYLKQYVFKNLKKKIISLGNGAARNSLESFDFVYKSKDFSLVNKKHLLSTYLRSIKIDFPKSTYKNRLNKYNTYFLEDKKLVGNRAFLKSIDSVTKNVFLKDVFENETTLKAILDKNKGKVVFVDFWASWCAPCRQAFPSYKSLRKKYSEKEILFLFISGDSDLYKWGKANQKEKLTNSYLDLNFGKSEFYQKLNLYSFPRYLIFNKKGELTTEKAPGPDSDNIQDFLDEQILDK